MASSFHNQPITTSPPILKGKLELYSNRFESRKKMNNLYFDMDISLLNLPWHFHCQASNTTILQWISDRFIPSFPSRGFHLIPCFHSPTRWLNTMIHVSGPGLRVRTIHFLARDPLFRTTTTTTPRPHRGWWIWDNLQFRVLRSRSCLLVPRSRCSRKLLSRILQLPRSRHLAVIDMQHLEIKLIFKEVETITD
jgi:hypothetical protein